MAGSLRAVYPARRRDERQRFGLPTPLYLGCGAIIHRQSASPPTSPWWLRTSPCRKSGGLVRRVLPSASVGETGQKSPYPRLTRPHFIRDANVLTRRAPAASPRCSAKISAPQTIPATPTRTSATQPTSAVSSPRDTGRRPIWTSWPLSESDPQTPRLGRRVALDPEAASSLPVPVVGVTTRLVRAAARSSAYLQQQQGEQVQVQPQCGQVKLHHLLSETRRSGKTRRRP